MGDLRRHRALAAIVAIREAERGDAQQQLLTATVREREAEAARDRADARTAAAAEAWGRQLDAGFDPALATALALELIEQAAGAKTAHDHARASAEARERRADDWHGADARHRQAGELLDATRKRIARGRTEAALETVEDRVTQLWRGGA